MTTEAWQKVLNIIGGQYKERWPDEESRIIFHSTVFTYKQRLTALTFLYGNLRDADLVYSAINPQLGVDARDHDHARRFLADLASGKCARQRLALPFWRSQHTALAAQPVRARGACVGCGVRAHAARGGPVADARRAARVWVDPVSPVRLILYVLFLYVVDPGVDPQNTTSQSPHNP